MTSRQRTVTNTARDYAIQVPARYLIDRVGQPRVRRSTDLTTLVVALIVIWISWVNFESNPDHLAQASRFVDLFPTWLNGLFRALFGIGAVYAVLLTLLIAFQGRARIDAVRDILLAAGLALGAVVIAVQATGGAFPDLFPELVSGQYEPQFPVLRISLVTAVLVVATPHLTRPLRRLGWTLVFLTAFSAAALGFGLVSGVIAAVAFGVVAAKIVLLGFGSPAGYPDLEAITTALAGLGLVVTDLELAIDQSWGVRRLIGRSPEHGPIEVKAFGRDATDSRLAVRLWRYAWYRDTEASLMLTRQQHVEHEALVTVIAERSGASVARYLAAGVAGDDLAVIAMTHEGESLRGIAPDEIESDHLVALWGSVEAFHAASVSHGALGIEALRYGPQGFVISDFSSGRLSAPVGFQLIDLANLLFSLASLVGVERSVASATEALGSERLGQVLPYLQVPAIAGSVADDSEEPKQLMEAVRTEVTDVVGKVGPTEKIELRRVSPKSFIIWALTLVALYFLVSQLSEIDFASVWVELQDADWAWLILATIFAQLMYFPQATSMLAAAGRPIPMKPLVILQSATMFAGLALSSTAARVTINTVFLRRYGINFAGSVALAAVESVSGLIVEVIILLTAFLLGDVRLELETGDVAWGLVIAIAVALIAVAGVLLWRSERVQGVVLPALREGWASFIGVVKDPRRASLLFASNLGSRLILAIAFWLILYGFGVSIGIFQALTIVVASSLLAGVVPIPGGVGVTEAILTAGLVFIGVDEAVGFAAAVVYRVASFYLPAAAGFLSMKWLERHDHI